MSELTREQIEKIRPKGDMPVPDCWITALCNMALRTHDAEERAEKAEHWNRRVSVCREHTDEIVDGECVVCRVERAEAEAALFKRDLQTIAENGDVYGERAEHHALGSLMQSAPPASEPNPECPVCGGRGVTKDMETGDDRPKDYPCPRCSQDTTRATTGNREYEAHHTLFHWPRSDQRFTYTDPAPADRPDEVEALRQQVEQLQDELANQRRIADRWHRLLHGENRADFHAGHPEPSEALDVPWSFCPECGNESYGDLSETHKICRECNQDWHTDVDYRDVVKKNLQALSHPSPHVGGESQGGGGVLDKHSADAHMFPCDLETLRYSETSRTAFSVPMMSPGKGDTVPLFTADTIRKSRADLTHPALPGAVRQLVDKWIDAATNEEIVAPTDGRDMLHSCAHQLEATLADSAPAPTDYVRPDYSLRCGECGRAHILDTSIPSHIWNQIARREELLCPVCIDMRLVQHGLSAEAEFYYAGKGLKSRLYGEGTPYGEQQAGGAVPDVIKTYHGYVPPEDGDAGDYYVEGWNDCRQAMLDAFAAAPTPEPSEGGTHD